MHYSFIPPLAYLLCLFDIIGFNFYLLVVSRFGVLQLLPDLVVPYSFSILLMIYYLLADVPVLRSSIYKPIILLWL